jgi:hypothetical protein
MKIKVASQLVYPNKQTQAYLPFHIHFLTSKDFFYARASDNLSPFALQNKTEFYAFQVAN